MALRGWVVVVVEAGRWTSTRVVGAVADEGAEGWTLDEAAMRACAFARCVRGLDASRPVRMGVDDDVLRTSSRPVRVGVDDDVLRTSSRAALRG